LNFTTNQNFSSCNGLGPQKNTSCKDQLINGWISEEKILELSLKNPKRLIFLNLDD